MKKKKNRNRFLEKRERFVSEQSGREDANRANECHADKHVEDEHVANAAPDERSIDVFMIEAEGDVIKNEPAGDYVVLTDDKAVCETTARSARGKMSDMRSNGNSKRKRKPKVGKNAKPMRSHSDAKETKGADLESYGKLVKAFFENAAGRLHSWLRGMDFFTKMTWIMVVFSALVVILFFVSTCTAMAERKPKGSERSAGENLINVSVMKMHQGPFHMDLVLNADLKSLNGSVAIASPVSGTLIRNFVRLGDKVKAGDELGIVDASDIGLNYNAAPVVAKSDGTITSIGASVNQKVALGSALYVIEPEPDFVLTASVSESDADALRLGANAYFTTAGDRTKRHAAVLTYIAPFVNASTRTVDIELAVDKSADNVFGLRAGSFVELTIVKSEIENVFVVPKDAIRTFAGESVVYLVGSDGIARRSSVTTGLSTQSQVVIESGLSEGDAVVIQGSPQDGDKVHVL
ncbi:MAG TPA: hypothetical protein DCO86_04355 [Spirochaetaceae bacterium]|nr:hypothetical protein [Spirochaetaceae bacterium]